MPKSSKSRRSSPKSRRSSPKSRRSSPKSRRSSPKSRRASPQKSIRCWTGYVKKGTKIKSGRVVNNCVREKKYPKRI